MERRATRLNRSIGLLLAGCATIFSVPQGLAQSMPDAREAATPAPADIVVTAQRRAERLEEVPMSVTALGPTDLQSQGVFDFDNLTRATTGIRISRTGVFTQPAIRGISTQTLGSGAENNVATYVDGIYQPDQLTLSGDLVGISDVQILKGPQGALYGRNATGGAILVNTLDPHSDRFEGSAHLGYARYDDYRADAHVNVPITDRIAFNVVGNYRDTNGYIRDITGVYNGTGAITDPPPYKNDRNIGYIRDWGVRAKLRFEIGSDASATIAYRHRFFADNRGTAFFMTDYAALPQDPGIGFNRDGYDYVAGSVPNTNDVNLDEVTGRVEIGTGLGTLAAYTAYTDQKAVFNADYDGVKADVVQAGGIFRRQTFQQGFDFNIDKVDRLNLVVGAHYYDDDAPGTSDTVLGGVLAQSVLNRLRTKAWAIFADGSYEITDGLHLTLGGRYSREIKRFTSVYDCCGQAGSSLFAAGGERRAAFSNFSPRAVLRYEISPRTNIYASVSRGFKSGTFNSVGSTQASVDTEAVRPETITAYELGFKTAQADFRVEAAAYYYDYKNLQLTRLLLGATIDQTLENAAKAEIYGAELSAQWSPMEPLTLNASANYNHARYKSFPSGAASIPIGGFIESRSQNFSGRRIPRAPDWTLNFTADYVIPVGSGSVTLNGNAFYSSKYVPTTPSYDPATGRDYFSQPGYAQVNAAVTWRSGDDRFELGAYVNNIFNERYRIWYNATALGAWYVLSEPTVWGLRAGVNF